MEHNHNNTVISSSDVNRSFKIGIALNVIYVIVEIIYGFQQNSTSLLSDAAHNVGDISGLLLAYLAFKLMGTRDSSTFTYGYRKGSIVASFINSILLAFAIGAIAWHGVNKILEPSPLSGSIIIWVAGVGVIINFVSAILFMKEKDNDLNVKAAYWHLMADALVSLGVVVSGILIHYFQWYILDGITAIIIAFVVLLSTWRLFKDSVIAILDGVPSSVNPQEIKQHLLLVEGVENIHHLHIWGMSTNENAMTAHVVVDNLHNIPRIKSSLKNELEEHNLKHNTLEFELYSEGCNELEK